MDKLEWQCISYHEEWASSNELLHINITMEAKHRNGWLVKEIFINHEGIKSSAGEISHSLTFIPEK